MRVLKCLSILGVTLLAACGSPAQYPPTIAPRQTTPQPTVDTAAITPTVTAEQAGAVLSGGGRFSSSDGRLTFVYPQGWFVQEQPNDQFIITNDRVALSNVPGPGQYQINLVVSPIGEVPLGSQDAVQANLSARQVLEQLVSGYAGEGSSTTASAPAEESLGGRTAYTSRLSNPQFDGLLMVFDAGNGTHIALAAVSARGELNLLEPVARGVGASVRYAP
ncbi:MAG: hypothetical protein HXY40_16610 [Chloroflexi bacterium]|nr:hypothetical protein [Chloroflexota bacterium]